MASKLSKPVSIQIEITENCNQRCFYCYNSRQFNDKVNKNMSAETADRLIKIINEKIEPFFVTLTGGEPFMNMPVLLKFIKNFEQKGIKYSINTNLSLAAPENISLIKQTAKEIILFVSLPNYERGKFNQITQSSNFDRVYENLKNIVKDEAIKVTVNMAVHKLNFDDVYNEAKFLHENYNLKSFCASPITPPVGDTDSYLMQNLLAVNEVAQLIDTLAKIKEELGVRVDIAEPIPKCIMPAKVREDKSLFKKQCPVGRSYLAIDYQGNARQCPHSAGIIGNLLEEKFEVIWRKILDLKDRRAVPEECTKCDAFKFCRAGCMFANFKGWAETRKEYIKTQEKIQRTIPELDAEQEYWINKKISVRKERQGVYTFYNRSNPQTIIVNSAMRDIMNHLLTLDKIKPSDLLKELSQEDSKKIELYLRVLLDRGFILRHPKLNS